jgi:hypothetical protein
VGLQRKSLLLGQDHSRQERAGEGYIPHDRLTPIKEGTVGQVDGKFQGQIGAFPRMHPLVLVLELVQVVSELPGNLENLPDRFLLEYGASPLVEDLVDARHVKTDTTGNLVLSYHARSLHAVSFWGTPTRTARPAGGH